MGNCCSGDHPKPDNTSQLPLPGPPLGAQGSEYAHDDHPRTGYTSNATSTPFMETPDTMAVEAETETSFLLRKKLAGDHLKAANSAASRTSREEGSRLRLSEFEPKLASLLEFFRCLYVRRKELFRRVISVHGEELEEVLKRIGQVEEGIERPRIQQIQRSQSSGASQDPKNDRFKVKTFNITEKPPTRGKGGGARGGSK